MKKELSFKNRKQFREWLGKQENKANGIWVVFSKLKSIVTLSANEALEEALCFGWIDGLIKKIDEDRYKKYFSPRKKGSKWSEKNKKIAKRLIAEAKMDEKGLLVIENAKKDGTWNIKQDRIISDEKYKIFESLIKSNEMAFNNYLMMAKLKKQQFVGLYFDAKREETKQKRLKELIELLERNISPMKKYSEKK